MFLTVEGAPNFNYFFITTIYRKIRSCVIVVIYNLNERKLVALHTLDKINN